jgi:hypothetical protein
MLLTLGDGNWNPQENYSREKTGRGVSGNVVMQHYFGKINIVIYSFFI